MIHDFEITFGNSRLWRPDDFVVFFVSHVAKFYLLGFLIDVSKSNLSFGCLGPKKGSKSPLIQ